MCYCDIEGPSAFSVTTRKARKPHRCVECWEYIKPGDVYTYKSGIWECAPDSFHICALCSAVEAAWYHRYRELKTMAVIGSARWDAGPCEPCYAFGGMWEAIAEWLRG